MNRSSKVEEDDNFKPPNFDNFLNYNPQQQQQQQPHQQPHQQQQPQGYYGASNEKTQHGFQPTAAPSSGSAFGKVRIHQTQMQSYLHGLMQSQNDQQADTFSKVDSNMGIMKQGQNMNQMLAKSSYLKGNIKGEGGGGTTGANSRTPTPGSGNDGGHKDESRTNSPLGSSQGGGGNSSSTRQKNDKAVEVHYDKTVIARFRTQTECARYLRATPEAVSYHCSKGGGICNGLVIRPLGAAEVTHMMNDYLQEQESTDQAITPYFGLFEGAVQHRPKERPQLKPETVAILKEWLLSPEHMDNPYPNQRESEMLMEKTGLDKTQLKHWFNNARKRILKPLLKNGGRRQIMPARPNKKRGSSGGAGQARKKRRSTSDVDDGRDANVSAVLQGGSSSCSPNIGGGMSMRPGEFEDRRHMRARQFDDPFAQQNGPNSESNMMMNQYDRMMGYSNAMNSGMMQGGDMMGYGESMGMMGDNSRGFNDPMGAGGGYQTRGMGNPMGGGFNTYANINDSAHSQQSQSQMNDSQHSYTRYSDDYSQNRMNSQGGFQQEIYPQDRFNQDGYNSNSPYGPPNLGPQGQDPREPAAGASGSLDETARSNAVFKQQVATMAMNEASTAFKDMEDAFAHAKGVLAASRNKRAQSGAEGPDDDPMQDPMVLEANAHAKKCQSVAMFKLKVSQRASEEAANAYDSYQRMVDGIEGNVGMDGTERLMMLPGNEDNPF
eukprot:CAMPEP_0183734328 /NCGR_PEP_ID=MMETSP0737-20130205/43511_1 /TAXON_ID=385413 /ORGANISM="Thalassiosira miniscula, Strain CCMP1093" /LENGTH=717 /DNA_ID=CAMNT_0025967793 /DNA_START=413 /DNA_END=2569 /DNA_ORIENTATION=+